MGKCLLGLSARWHEPNTHCCTTLTHSHTHIHAPTFHLKSIGHHQRQRRQQQQPIWDSTKQNTTQKHWDWASIRALVRSPSMRFPPRLPVSLPLIELFSYWYIYIYIWSIYILYSTYWLWWLYDIHVIYTFLSGQPKQNGRSNIQSDPLTHLISSSNQATCTHSLSLPENTSFLKNNFIKQILLYLFWSDV